MNEIARTCSLLIDAMGCINLQFSQSKSPIEATSVLIEDRIGSGIQSGFCPDLHAILRYAAAGGWSI